MFLFHGATLLHSSHMIILALYSSNFLIIFRHSETATLKRDACNLACTHCNCNHKVYLAHGTKRNKRSSQHRTKRPSLQKHKTSHRTEKLSLLFTKNYYSSGLQSLHRKMFAKNCFHCLSSSCLLHLPKNQLFAKPL